jgi:hypothetical protein
VQTSLSEAVAEAIRSGTDELDRLASLIKEAEQRLGGSARPVRDGGPKSVEADGYSFLLDVAASDLVDKLDRNRVVLSTFNVVFFGRTGAGKSTLLSALGRLDGELVSDGCNPGGWADLWLAGVGAGLRWRSPRWSVR